MFEFHVCIFCICFIDEIGLYIHGVTPEFVPFFMSKSESCEYFRFFGCLYVWMFGGPQPDTSIHPYIHPNLSPVALYNITHSIRVLFVQIVQTCCSAKAHIEVRLVYIVRCMDTQMYGCMDVRQLYTSTYIYQQTSIVCMYSYVCISMHVLVCMYQFVCLSMYVLVCMYQFVCISLYVLVCMYQYVWGRFSAFEDPSKKCLQKTILIRFRAHFRSLVWGGTREGQQS